jgi:uncharacterized HhH-GPD family protein
MGHGQSFFITGDPDADALLASEPLALLIGMLLDQQVPMEWAFGAPIKLKERLGGTLDAATIAAMPTDELEVLFKGPPALHRFPGSMAKRTQQLCQHLVDHYDGRAEAVWTGVQTGAELFDRLHALPGSSWRSSPSGSASGPPGGRSRPTPSPTTRTARSPTSAHPKRCSRSAPSRR